MTEPTAHLQRLEQELQAQVQAWRLHPVVEALQALRGVPCTVAVTLVAEIGDVTRFEHPRELMKFLGLIPSEYSTGDHRRQGAMTKAGNPQARRALIAGAWAYRSPAKVSRHLQLRLENQPKVIQDIRWKAQVRLCRRYRRLGTRGKHANVVTGAIARELVGFLWAIANQVPVTPEGHRSHRYCTPNSEGFRRASEKTQPRCGVPLGGVQRLGAGYSCRDSGRHPTEASKVGANPRIAAGSTVVAYWLRLFRCTEVKKQYADLKNSAAHS